MVITRYSHIEALKYALFIKNVGPHGQGGVDGRVEGVEHSAHKTSEWIDRRDACGRFSVMFGTH